MNNQSKEHLYTGNIRLFMSRQLLEEIIRQY